MNTNVFPMGDALTAKLTMRSLGFSPNDASLRSTLFIGLIRLAISHAGARRHTMQARTFGQAQRASYT